jgi:hypothetical protein
VNNPEHELWQAIDALGPKMDRFGSRDGAFRVNNAIRDLIEAVRKGKWPPPVVPVFPACEDGS